MYTAIQDLTESRAHIRDDGFLCSDTKEFTSSQETQVEVRNFPLLKYNLLELFLAGTIDSRDLQVRKHD